jgi:galactokinase
MCLQARSRLACPLPGYAITHVAATADFARHAIEEIECVKQASLNLVRDDASGFGRLMIAGHASLRDLYEVSLPQLDDLVEIALNQAGCFGARLCGAGFGGFTIYLDEKLKAEEFTAALADEYTLKTGIKIETYICQATRGAYADPL